MSQASNLPGSGMAEWKEGQLFPEGWEDMGLFQKACPTSFLELQLGTVICTS